jgi:hypothetical protein
MPSRGGAASMRAGAVSVPAGVTRQCDAAGWETRDSRGGWASVFGSIRGGRAAMQWCGPIGTNPTSALAA